MPDAVMGSWKRSSACSGWVEQSTRITAVLVAPRASLTVAGERILGDNPKPLFVGSIPTGASFDMARILIIDDDVTLRQALTKHLEHAGHEVRQAAEGDAGIRAYERHSADVVIVDIFMPGQGGLQTIGRLRREWPAVKIVAMSGVKSAGAIDVGGHAVALGADRFLTKPFEAATLVALVSTLLGDAKEEGAP